MPLLDENRIIVRAGLKSLIPGDNPVPGPRPGVLELLEKLELAGSHFDAKDIAWKICPAINAARRMGCPEQAAALFFEKNPLERNRLAEALLALNKQRKSLEEDIWSMAEPMAYSSLADYEQKLALVYGEEINKGVTGLIAQRITRRFNVPALVISFSGELYTGSIRSARAYSIGGLLEQCGDLFIDFGGHEFAGGFSLKKEYWDAFIKRLKTIASSIEFEKDPKEQSISIDAELPAEYFTPDILNLVDRFAPYGQDNEQIIFMTKNLIIEELNFIGKNESKHLKMLLATGKHKWPALFWDAAARVINKEFDKGDRVDAVFTLSRDWYKGIATPQMMIVDMRRSE
jgi:single-stranded-DNA-specific exonuclease